MKRIDFTGCQESNIQYSGADEKVGIVYCESRLMLKFKTKTPYGEAYNDISEYIGTSVFKLLDFETQDVFLGLYNNRKVVACKDFLYPNKVFKPFSDVGESSVNEDDSYSYSFEDIQKLIYDSCRFKEPDKETVIKTFWDTYVVDCLLANGDRHAKNWGFIKENGFYKIAPIFDNGNCLFPKVVDEQEIADEINSEEELKEKVEQYPKSLIRLGNSISDYYSVIRSKTFDDCNNAIKRIVPKIDLEKINKIIDEVENDDLSENRKMFLKKIIKLRFERILQATYEELV